jgi:hypothetical protein
MSLGRLKMGLEGGPGFTWFNKYGSASCGCWFLTILGIYFCWAGPDCKCSACGNWSCSCEDFFESIAGEDFSEYPEE